MANIFANLFKKHTSGSVLGVDIGSSSIKDVQLKKKGGKVLLETYGELALGPYGGVEIGQATSLSIEKIVEALADLLQEKEVNITTNQAAVAIPFSSSLMAVMELPLLSFKQLSSMVPLEARKYIPVPISEVTLDWSVIPKEEVKTDEEDDNDKPEDSKVQRTDILLVAIHNETLTKYQDIVRKTGLQSTFFEIEIFSTMRSVLGDDHEPVMLADLGAATTKLYIVERGVVRFSHTINRGAQDVTSMISKSLGISMHDAEVMKRSVGAVAGGATDIRDVISLSLGHIFAETNQAILNYQKKYGRTLSKIIFVGGGSSLKGIKELAQDNFQIEVVPGNPFSKTEAPAFLEEVLRTTGPEFAVAVGLALRKIQEDI